MSILNILSRTKLYWGLIAIFLIGVLGSPISSKGNNIFLSYGNLLDVLRQVSTTGLIATGMTAVIITGGIDLSVGSLMAICTVVCHATDGSGRHAGGGAGGADSCRSRPLPRHSGHPLHLPEHRKIPRRPAGHPRHQAG